MVKYENERVLPNSKLPISYDKKVELTASRNSVFIDMDKKWRSTEGHADCDFAGYWQDGGSEACTLYIGVECQELEEMCAFKISL
jgi:hypothetical protein